MPAFGRVVLLRSVCLASLLCQSFSVKDLTPSLSSGPATLQYQAQHTRGVYTYNVTTPGSLYLEVQPCSGAFNWTFSKPSGTTVAKPPVTTLATGGYRGVAIEAGDSLVGHHTETYLSANASLGTYYLVIEAGDGGWLPYVYFKLFIWSSPRQENPPQLPEDDRVSATMTTTSRVRLTWEPSLTAGVEYCIYYHMEKDADESFVHSSTCSTHYTHAGSRKICTTNSNYDITGLIAGTTYNFNVIVARPSSNIRSVYRGVRIRTLTDSDMVGEWSVFGRMETDILVDNQQKSTYVRERYERVYDFVMERPSKVVKFVVRPCGGFVHWVITAPNGTVLQQGSFKGSDLTGVTTNGYLPRESEQLVVKSPQFGIYKVTVRGGNHTADASSYVYFQIFATTQPDTYYYPVLPADDKIRVVEHSTDGLTIEWDPSPTAGIRYCVYYHEVKYSRPYFVYSSGCSTHYTSASISGPCVTDTTVRLANRSSHSLMYADTSYYINVVVFKPEVSQVRSAYVGVLASTMDPTSPPPVATVRGRQPDGVISRGATQPQPITDKIKSSTPSLSLSTLASLIVTIVAIGLLM